MNERLQSAVEGLTTRFAARLHEHAGDVQLYLSVDQIVDACRALKDEYAFEMLSFITGVDYWPQQDPRFNLIYGLYSFQFNNTIYLRVSLDGNAPHVPTVEGIYPNANWYEREVYDMFGVIFDGHSDLRRILMPADWEGHPLRKDYPLGYEEVQFTFNVDEIDRTKIYAVRENRIKPAAPES